MSVDCYFIPLLNVLHRGYLLQMDMVDVCHAPKVSPWASCTFYPVVVDALLCLMTVFYCDVVHFVFDCPGAFCPGGGRAWPLAGYCQSHILSEYYLSHFVFVSVDRE
jgi:hypothetical protein